MYVVEGQPYKLTEPRSFSDGYGGERETIGFSLLHPDLEPPKEGEWEDSFEAGNGLIARIQKAAKDQDVIRLVVRQYKVPGKHGKDPWQKNVCLRVIE